MLIYFLCQNYPFYFVSNSVIYVESSAFHSVLESLSSLINALWGLGLKKSIETLFFNASSGRFLGYIFTRFLQLKAYYSKFIIFSLFSDKN